MVALIGLRKNMNQSTQKLNLLIKRFPVAIAFILALAVICFITISKDETFPCGLPVFLSGGILLSVSVILLCEDYFNYLKSNLIALFVVLLWGVYSYFLPEKWDDVSLMKSIEVVVLEVSFFFSVFFISFFKRNSDSEVYNFTEHTVFQLAIACFFGVVIYAGVYAAISASESLFNFTANKHIEGYLSVICFLLFSSIYFLAGIFNKNDKHNDVLFFNKVKKIFALYILTPILALYALILYIYLFQIIFKWELPNGTVSWLVSALAVGGLIVTGVLYPMAREGDNKVVNFISRWFGLLILPLLVLMTIGIFRRINDYGVTINRCYVLLANIWFYGIYIYLFVSKSRHIKWILISFIAIALLSSISVWGVAKYTKNTIVEEVSSVLTEKMSIDEARVMISKMEPTEKDKFLGKMQYLYSTYGEESIKPFFTDPEDKFNFQLLSEDKKEDEKEKKYINYYRDETAHNISGYKYYRYQKFESYGPRDSVIRDTVCFEINNDAVSLPIRDMALKYRETGDKSVWTYTEKDIKVIVEVYHGVYFPLKDSLSVTAVEGSVFSK